MTPCSRKGHFRISILFGLLFFCAASLSCSSQATKGLSAADSLEIEGVVIVNQLNFSIADVQILVITSGEFVSCGTVLRKSSCSTSFPGRTYRGKKVRVSWKELGIPRSSGDFVIDIPTHLDKARSAWVEVVVFAPGQAGARLTQSL